MASQWHAKFCSMLCICSVVCFEMGYSSHCIEKDIRLLPGYPKDVTYDTCMALQANNLVFYNSENRKACEVYGVYDPTNTEDTLFFCKNNIISGIEYVRNQFPSANNSCMGICSGDNKCIAGFKHPQRGSGQCENHNIVVDGPESFVKYDLGCQILHLNGILGYPMESSACQCMDLQGKGDVDIVVHSQGQDDPCDAFQSAQLSHSTFPLYLCGNSGEYPISYIGGKFPLAGQTCRDICEADPSCLVADTEQPGDYGCRNHYIDFESPEARIKF